MTSHGHGEMSVLPGGPDPRTITTYNMHHYHWPAVLGTAFAARRSESRGIRLPVIRQGPGKGRTAMGGIFRQWA